MPRLQNIVSESRLTLTVMAVYGVAVWLACGLVSRGLWASLTCFAASVALMSLINNAFALIRIYSRMVASSYIALSCAACFQFGSVATAALSLCVMGCIGQLFRCYQDALSPGRAVYAFALIGVGSLFSVHVLCLVPLLWALMATCLMCLSWRTLLASLLGLGLPYWIWSAYTMARGQWPEVAHHFAPLTRLGTVAALGAMPLGHLLALALTFVAGLVGAIHYYRQRHDDKIRTRMFHNCFVTMWMASALAVVLQPQLFHLCLCVMTIASSALLAHFAALSHTRLTNMAFVALAVATLAITVLNALHGNFRF